MRDGVKAPANCPGTHVKSADVARRGWKILCHQPANDEKVAVDNSRTCGRDRDLVPIAAQTFPQIHAASGAESCDRQSGARIERVEPVPRDEKNPPIVSVRPIGDAPVSNRMRDRCAFVWIETRSEEHTSELQSACNLVCRLLLEKK